MSVCFCVLACGVTFLLDVHVCPELYQLVSRGIGRQALSAASFFAYFFLIDVGGILLLPLFFYVLSLAIGMHQPTPIKALQLKQRYSALS